MTSLRLLLCLVATFSLAAAANPTGRPVGGGDGYGEWVSGDSTPVSSLAELLQRLAIARPGDVVYVADDAAIDLSGRWSIDLNEGVTLASGRGRAGSLGGLLYTRTKDREPLFEITGPGVRVTGLRIRGPDTTVDGPGCGRLDATGIQASEATLVDWHPRIDNNEFWGWPAAAVHFSMISGSHVHHNHIHHNRREERSNDCRHYGLGYGVRSDVGTALIEANLFDHNRHDIASSGRPGSSYEARYNISVMGLISHSFDMHGCRDDPDHEECLGHRNTAGTRIDIHDNTFLDTSEPAVVVRGVPEEGAFVSNNHLAHAPNANAIFQRYSSGRMLLEGNEYRLSPTKGWFASFSGRSFWTFRERSSYSITMLGVGDFDGDGRNDAFRSSGGHWYISSAFRDKWQRWNNSNVGVASLRFGDFNGDGITDVFRANGQHWFVSWSGRSRWEQVNRSPYRIGSLAVADFNGDGVDDIFRADSGNWHVSWGGRTVWERINHSEHSLSNIEIGDLNGDGEADILRTSASKWFVSWSGTTSWQVLNSSAVRLRHLKLCDFDRDGADDIFYANGSEWLVSWSGQSRWERLNSSSFTNVAVADVNGDQVCDVLSHRDF